MLLFKKSIQFKNNKYYNKIIIIYDHILLYCSDILTVLNPH